MTTANPTTTTTGVDEPLDAATGGCAACEHPSSAHDPLGVRFCAATVAAALSRGCICR